MYDHGPAQKSELSHRWDTRVGRPAQVSVDIEGVMNMANLSFQVSEMYDQVTRMLSDTDPARGELTDKDGEATPADQEILDLLDEFEGYLRTTTARYYLTGEQLVTAAQRYTAADESASERLERMIDSMENLGYGDYEGEGDPNRQARDTNRPDAATDEQADGYATDENPAESDDEAPRD